MSIRINGDNIKSDIFLPVGGMNVFIGGFQDFLFLVFGHKGFWSAVGLIRPQFHFYKHQQPIVKHSYNVYLRTAGAVILLHYFKAQPLQVCHRQ